MGIYAGMSFRTDSLVITPEILALIAEIEEFKGALSVRCVEFRKGEELIVTARSQWCLIGAKDQKPKRVPKDFLDLFI